MRSETDANYVTEIGRRIRSARMTAGVSQTALGDKVGVTFQQVQKYENGTNQPPPPKLLRIAQALNTTVPHLLGLDAAGIAADPRTVLLQNLDADPVCHKALDVLLDAVARDPSLGRARQLCRVIAAFNEHVS